MKKLFEKLKSAGASLLAAAEMVLSAIILAAFVATVLFIAAVVLAVNLFVVLVAVLGALLEYLCYLPMLYICKGLPDSSQHSDNADKDVCPYCGKGEFEKALYMGFPLRLCNRDQCATASGIGSWVMVVIRPEPDGWTIMTYEGSYWRALWHWLTSEDENES